MYNMATANERIKNPQPLRPDLPSEHQSAGSSLFYTQKTKKCIEPGLAPGDDLVGHLPWPGSQQRAHY